MTFDEMIDMLVKLGIDILEPASWEYSTTIRASVFCRDNRIFTVYHGMRGDTEHFYTIGIE